MKNKVELLPVDSAAYVAGTNDILRAIIPSLIASGVIDPETFSIHLQGIATTWQRRKNPDRALPAEVMLDAMPRIVSELKALAPLTTPPSVNDSSERH